MKRRTFFKSLISEAIHLREEMQGIPQLRLSEIKHLPNETVSQMMPMVTEDYEVKTDRTYIRIYHRRSGSTIRFFAPEPARIIALELFNGTTSLQEIGYQLTAQMGWDEEQGFAYVKNLFLTLVDHGVCVPSNPVD